MILSKQTVNSDPERAGNGQCRSYGRIGQAPLNLGQIASGKRRILCELIKRHSALNS